MFEAPRSDKKLLQQLWAEIVRHSCIIGDGGHDRTGICYELDGKLIVSSDFRQDYDYELDKFVVSPPLDEQLKYGPMGEYNYTVNFCPMCGFKL